MLKFYCLVVAFNVCDRRYRSQKSRLDGKSHKNHDLLRDSSSLPRRRPFFNRESGSQWKCRLDDWYFCWTDCWRCTHCLRTAVWIDASKRQWRGCSSGLMGWRRPYQQGKNMQINGIWLFCASDESMGYIVRSKTDFFWQSSWLTSSSEQFNCLWSGPSDHFLLPLSSFQPHCRHTLLFGLDQSY